MQQKRAVVLSTSIATVTLCPSLRPTIGKTLSRAVGLGIEAPAVLLSLPAGASLFPDNLFTAFAGQNNQDLQVNS